jgi:signal transduction histidine kinase
MATENPTDLFSLYDRMIGDVDIHEVLREVTEVVREKLHAETATTYLVREDTQELESVALVGNVKQVIRVPICETSLAGFCAVSRRAFLVDDAYGDLSHISPTVRFDRSWDERNDFRTHDVMCAPALFEDKVYGVVQAINNRAAKFSKEDLASLVEISRLVGYALYHARMYDELSTLKALEKQKAEFMRVVVHELKSPVSGSKMLASALEYSNRDNPKVTQVTGKIGARLDHLLELIEDILHLSRVKSGTPLGDIETFDAVEATRKGCESYAEEAAAKGLRMVVELDNGPLPIRFDRTGYALVVSNLVSNAVKYTPVGSVTLWLAGSHGEVVLRVSDTGLGIPKKDIPKLFQEFFRASNVRAGDIKGTGVGLAGAKQLVERFGGTMALESEENKGSTFTVRLPMAG